MAKFLNFSKLCPTNKFDDGDFRFVAIYAKNREEWTISDFGAMLTGITVVTLYDTLGEDSTEYIIDQTKIKTCFLSADKIKLILSLKKKGKIPSLDHLIHFDPVSEEIAKQAKEFDVKLISYKDAIE